MPPERHAVLSASSSHRWLHCNPSARLELEFEDRETEAAAEGTAAHALAEHKLRKALKMRSTRPVSKYDSDEMELYTDGYMEFVLEAIEEARKDCPDPKVLIEQRLDFSCYVPDGFGTGDCLIVADKLLHIIDLKYGQGVLVSAEENPQMMLYALGALRIFDCLYDIETVSMTIYQDHSFFEFLCHNNQRFIDRAVSMWMIFTHGITDNTRALSMWLIRSQTEFRHCI